MKRFFRVLNAKMILGDYKPWNGYLFSVEKLVEGWAYRDFTLYTWQLEHWLDEGWIEEVEDFIDYKDAISGIPEEWKGLTLEEIQKTERYRLYS